MATIRVRIKEIIASRSDMTQKKLAEMTGLREATISAICRDNNTSINRDHLVLIMQALNISDISDVIVYED